jgi:penicillin-binding protein 2
LEEESISGDYKYVDTGSIKVGDFEYTNWYLTQHGRVEGEIDLVRALARSTDTFFYKAGELVGIDALVFWSDRFGLGKKSGIDLPGEVGGLLPDPSWKAAVKGERWFLGNTYHMAIGQGDLTATPLQVNMWTSVFANGGKLCRPFVVSSQREQECVDLNLSQESLELVRAGMIAACSAGGTGYPFFDFEPRVACKTGTAETFEDEETHAWFSAYAPLESPEIVVTVLVERGGEGSKVAAPVAREVFDWWFGGRNDGQENMDS